MKKETSIVIPARMESSRFFGKPLKMIRGLPMVIHCAQNALKTGLDVYVATNSKEIKSICSDYGINSIMTPECRTGTDRVAFASQELNSEYIINLQGDEPIIFTNSLNKIISSMTILEKNQNIILNGVSRIGLNKAKDLNNVKCSLIESKKRIQYFSRKPLINDILPNHEEVYYKQVGLYAITSENLKKFSAMKEGKLEKAERVELLRWIENGFEISYCVLDIDPIAVDTPNDLIEVEEFLKSN